ncbi:hypothetical protein SC09_Contig25orf00307 [Bacillus subtilis]|uniref:Uncharacterized protein n=1 Tax=Bacillus subtilis TaxID=1423 RepID=A0A0D1KWD8_BACIU|nr:hypothetical protein SC09_Contig25orf00307 [Bacillus subtilis]
MQDAVSLNDEMIDPLFQKLIKNHVLICRIFSCFTIAARLLKITLK